MDDAEKDYHPERAAKVQEVLRRTFRLLKEELK